MTDVFLFGLALSLQDFNELLLQSGDFSNTGKVFKPVRSRAGVLLFHTYSESVWPAQRARPPLRHAPPTLAPSAGVPSDVGAVRVPRPAPPRADPLRP